MVLARLLDRALCAENPNWFPIEGEEATVVGAYCDLLPTDVAAPHYRDPFVVYLMRGAEMWRLAAQVLRKGAGYNKGRSVPFNGPFPLGHVPWVAGDLGTTLGTATGAALAPQDAGPDDEPARRRARPARSPGEPADRTRRGRRRDAGADRDRRQGRGGDGAGPGQRATGGRPR